MAKHQPTGRAPGNPNWGRRANGTGRSGNRTGKSKGTRSHLARAMERGALSASDRLTPLEVLLAVSNGDAAQLARIGLTPRQITPLLQVRATESAAPYMHRKQPTAIELPPPPNTAVTKLLTELPRDGAVWLGTAARIILEWRRRQQRQQSEVIDVAA